MVIVLVELGLAVILGLGFASGLKHALDADHIVAISTIVSEHKSFFRSTMVGASWGIGHTFTLLMVGLVVLTARVSIPVKLALSFEALVGVVLILLGVSVLWRFVKSRMHVHPHTHDQHKHIHTHTPDVVESHHHSIPLRKKSIFVGMFHGMAGSAALTLVILSTVESVAVGVIYILIFGSGTILGMLLVSGLIGLPFRFTANRFTNINKGIGLVAGVLSIALGAFIIVEAFVLGVMLGV